MSKTTAVHVRYKSLYIALPSSAKQQREMAKFCVVHGTRKTTANFTYFHLELKTVFACLAFLEPFLSGRGPRHRRRRFLSS